MKKIPTKPGLYWAALDDGNGNVEVVMLRVCYYAGLNSFDEGAICVIVDHDQGEWPWTFEVKGFEQELVQPSKTVYAASRGATYREQVKITWHGPAKAPASALKQQPVAA